MKKHSSFSTAKQTHSLHSLQLSAYLKSTLLRIFKSMQELLQRLIITLWIICSTIWWGTGTGHREAVAAPSKKMLKDRLDGALSSRGRCTCHGRGLEQDGFYTLVSEPPESMPLCSRMGESEVHSEQFSPLQGSCRKSPVINLPLILFHRSPFLPSRVKWHRIWALFVQMS